MYHILYSISLLKHTGYVWRGIKTIPRPQEFYRARTAHPEILYIFVNSQQISNMIKHFLITPSWSKSGKRLSLVNRENTFNYHTQVPKLRRFVLLYPNAASGACGCTQSTHVRERQTQISLHVHVYIIGLVPQATKADD